jgi:hypothetical protein
MSWTSEPDRGMYDAVNKGLRQAQGEILAYLNSDDLYFPWTLETVVAYFRRHPEADVVFGDALAVDDDTGRQEIYWFPPFNLTHLRAVGFLAQPAVFWRRRVMEEEGLFDDTLRYVADCDYWMRIGARQRFAKLNEMLAIERRHEQTLREASEGAVWTELEGVRRRYVEPIGPRLEQRFKLRTKLWFRLYWAALAVQAAAPIRVPFGVAYRYVRTRETGIVWARALAMLVPGMARFQVGKVMVPSRHWLEPPE